MNLVAKAQAILWLVLLVCYMQEDMDEISKLAHSVKNQLEQMQKVNEAALTTKARHLDD